MNGKNQMLEEPLLVLVGTPLQGLLDVGFVVVAAFLAWDWIVSNRLGRWGGEGGGDGGGGCWRDDDNGSCGRAFADLKASSPTLL